MSNPSSSGAPIGLPPGTRPAAAHGAGDNGGYSLPPGAGGPTPPTGVSVPVGQGPLFPTGGPSANGATVGGGQPWLADVGTPAKKVERTYKDLPKDPPYGPILPFRNPPPPRRESGQESVPGDSSRITPLQIALGVGGILLLLALGIGGALLLLNNSDPQPEVANSPLPAESDEEGDPFGQFTPAPRPPAAPAPAPAPSDDPAATDPGGDGDTEPGSEAAPAEPGADDQDPATPGDGGDTPQGEPGGDTTPPEPDQDQGTTPDGAPAPQAPGQPPAATDPQDGEVELPLLFELRQLPRDTSEEDTTVTQTSRDDDDPSLEQVTRLDNPAGQITVRALRAGNAMERFEALQTDDARELTVRGQPAFLLEGQRLIWLVPGEPDTFLDIDGPATIGTDDLLTIANGLELN